MFMVYAFNIFDLSSFLIAEIGLLLKCNSNKESSITIAHIPYTPTASDEWRFLFLHLFFPQ